MLGGFSLAKLVAALLITSGVEENQLVLRVSILSKYSLSLISLLDIVVEFRSCFLLECSNVCCDTLNYGWSHKVLTSSRKAFKPQQHQLRWLFWFCMSLLHGYLTFCIKCLHIFSTNSIMFISCWCQTTMINLKQFQVSPSANML